ncbi:MAG: zinc-ribbon domain-containing protein [Minisyncoccota bacterium]
MRNCVKCGHPNPDDALFCGGCGEKLSPRVQHQRKIASAWLYAIIGAAVLLVVGLIVFALMSNRNSPPPQIPANSTKSVQTPARTAHKTPVRTTTNVQPAAAPAATPATSQPTATQPTVCTPNWQCNNWNACTGGGQQTRYCYDANGCGVTTGEPPIAQSCTCTPNWQCSGWGYCYGSQQGRYCVDANNCGASTGQPATTQSCVPPQ